MKHVVTKILAVALLVVMAASVAAQEDAAAVAEQARQLEERQMRAAERQVERARMLEERTQMLQARAGENGARAEEIDVQMREAEERLAEAAARVAELSTRRLPEMAASIARGMRAHGRAMLGITIGAEGRSDPVEGVTVTGVTPGSAAADAGLRAGDVITAVNGESLSADTEDEANHKLLDFMAGVEEGDALDVEYLRDGRSASLEVRPRHAYSFALRPGRHPFPPSASGAPLAQGFVAFHAAGSWGDMELVTLTEDLGRYFGTDKGLLIVRAPADKTLQLRDGDVIQSIDGREPASVSHAMRILASYQGGEKLDIEIMRDRKRQTVSIELPDNRQSRLPEFDAAAPRLIFRAGDPG